MEDISQLVTSGSRDWSRFYADLGAYFIRSAEINDYTLRLSEAIRVALPAEVEGKRSLIEKGDILVTITGANVGKCAKVDSNIPEAYVSQSVALIKLVDKEITTYVYYTLRAPHAGANQLEEMAYGVGRPVLSLPQIKSLRIPLAPRLEQIRIVAKIEELFKQVNVGRERLARVPKILKTLRQSVLAAACSGRLTQDWREKHADVEPTEKLLERIFRERRDRYRRLKARNSKNTERQILEVGELGELPDSWRWVAWNDLVDWITYGFTRPMPHEEEGIPIITAKNIHDGRIDFQYSDLTSRAAFDKLSDKDRPRKGEILVTKDGSIGRVAIVETDRPFSINQSVAVLRFGGTTAHVPYLMRVIESPSTQYLIEEGAKGTAIRHISITTFGTFPVPLPPIEEQHEIVRRVEALFELADKIEKRVETATKRSDKLIQAILLKAFRGELVQTEAELARQEGREYEPAKVLLERIKAEQVNDERMARNGRRRSRLENS
jgi:type I restriction enzyme S subunit